MGGTGGRPYRDGGNCNSHVAQYKTNAGRGIRDCHGLGRNLVLMDGGVMWTMPRSSQKRERGGIVVKYRRELRRFSPLSAIHVGINRILRKIQKSHPSCSNGHPHLTTHQTISYQTNDDVVVKNNPLIHSFYTILSYSNPRTMVRNPVFAILWLAILFFLAWPIAAACAGVR